MEAISSSVTDSSSLHNLTICCHADGRRHEPYGIGEVCGCSMAADWGDERRAGPTADQGRSMATILSRTNGSRENSDGYPVPIQSPANAESVLPDSVARELVRWFKLLADETRLRILFFLLEKRELNVRTLCELLELSQPAVSHHLALLRVDGLIECRRDGKHNYYRILPDRFGELLGMIVGAMPDEQVRFSFGDVSLRMERAHGQD